MSIHLFLFDSPSAAPNPVQHNLKDVPRIGELETRRGTDQWYEVVMVQHAFSDNEPQIDVHALLLTRDGKNVPVLEHSRKLMQQRRQV